MRRLILLLLVIAALSLFSSMAFAEDVKTAILKTAKRIDACIKAHDAKSLNTIYDPEGKFVTEDGDLCSQKQYIAGMIDTSIVYKSVKSTTTSVRVFGQTAIEMGHYVAIGRKNGKPIRSDLYYMTAWIKKGGRWIVTAEQCTNVAKTRSP
jgi:ketosteroid isomerase-like protein